MLFNSFEFILLFLPLSIIIFFRLAASTSQNIAMLWLVVASLFFYGWWNPVYLILIISSIIFNYILGNFILKYSNKVLLVLGVTANLALLAYFKYVNFFFESVSTITESNFNITDIALPLAISFFTFQQIAYLVDVYKGEVEEHSILRYALFVSFFPQLIAGPIVHHKEMLPQFSTKKRFILDHKHLAIGLAIFIIGLFKKVIIADGIAEFSTPVFTAADSGNLITFFEAWGGALAYTFQLYFDFSGYSDMAIGLARMFGIKLPINFNSPYKATSIIDFWRRWHITLSRFLKDYLYIPLGGNRKGIIRRHTNIIVTMLLGGLWHGAGWTFIAWGGLHGILLSINHLWRYIQRNTKMRNMRLGYAAPILGRTITFLSVVICWVFFRAETIDGAINILRGMVGMNGLVLDTKSAEYIPSFFGLINFSGKNIGSFGSTVGFIWLALLLVIVWFLPNTQKFVERRNIVIEESISSGLSWKPGYLWGVCLGIIGIYSILNLHNVSEFLYFNF